MRAASTIRVTIRAGVLGVLLALSAGGAGAVSLQQAY